MFDDKITIYGYIMKELILFAEVCRKCGITENELHQFCLNYEAIYRTLQKLFEEELHESLVRMYGLKVTKEEDGYDLTVADDVTDVFLKNVRCKHD